MYKYKIEHIYKYQELEVTSSPIRTWLFNSPSESLCEVPFFEHYIGLRFTSSLNWKMYIQSISENAVKNDRLILLFRGVSVFFFHALPLHESD